MNTQDPKSLGDFKAEKRTLVICLKAQAYGVKDPLPTKSEAGEIIRFDKFPELPAFVFKTSEGYWRVYDPKSGANLGCGGRTRKMALIEVFAMWNRLTSQRGTAEAVALVLNKLRAGWNDGKTLNPDFI